MADPPFCFGWSTFAGLAPLIVPALSDDTPVAIVEHEGDMGSAVQSNEPASHRHGRSDRLTVLSPCLLLPMIAGGVKWEPPYRLTPT